MRPTREAYVRAHGMLYGLEVHVGVEYRSEHEIGHIADLCEDFVANAFAQTDEIDHTPLVALVEAQVTHEWPDRAYFIETECAGKGVQVYMPFGMPKNPGDN